MVYENRIKVSAADAANQVQVAWSPYYWARSAADADTWRAYFDASVPQWIDSLRRHLPAAQIGDTHLLALAQNVVLMDVPYYVLAEVWPFVLQKFRLLMILMMRDAGSLAALMISQT